MPWSLLQAESVRTASLCLVALFVLFIDYILPHSLPWNWNSKVRAERSVTGLPTVANLGVIVFQVLNPISPTLYSFSASLMCFRSDKGFY